MNEQRTWTLQEAAEYLQMSPEALRQKALAGEIPGRKPGRRWVFNPDHLAEWLREPYTERRQAPRKEGVWHSTNAAMCSTSKSPTPGLDEQYADLLGLPASERRKRSTTG